MGGRCKSRRKIICAMSAGKNTRSNQGSGKVKEEANWGGSMFPKLWAAHCARSNRYWAVDKSTTIPIGIASERPAYFGSGTRIVFHISCLSSFPAIQDMTAKTTSVSMADENLENQTLCL